MFSDSRSSKSMFGDGYSVGRSRNNSSESMNTAKSMPDLSNPERVQQVPRPGSADLLTSENFEPTPDILDFYPSSMCKPEYLTIPIVKGNNGFGFTIADSAYGQKVKKILDRGRCKNLLEGDILVDINNVNVKGMSHTEVVQVLKDCPQGLEAIIMVQRGGLSSPSKSRPIKKEPTSPKKPSNSSAMSSGGLYRSKTPTADMYSSQQKEIIPNRPKTPLVDTRNRSKTPNMVGVGGIDDHHHHQVPDNRGGTGSDIPPSITEGGEQLPYPGAFSYTSNLRGGHPQYNSQIDNMSSHMNQMSIEQNNYENYNTGENPSYNTSTENQAYNISTEYHQDYRGSADHVHGGPPQSSTMSHHQSLSYHSNFHDNHYPPPHPPPPQQSDPYDYDGKRLLSKTPTMEYNSMGNSTYPQYSYYMNNNNSSGSNSNLLNNNPNNTSLEHNTGYGYMTGYDAPRQDSGYSSQAQAPPARNPYPPNYGQNSSAGYNSGTSMYAPNSSSYTGTSHNSSSYNNNNSNSAITNNFNYNQNDSLGRRKESTSFEYEHPAPVNMPR